MKIGRLIILNKRRARFRAKEFYLITLPLFPWAIIWISKLDKKEG